jgi:hypothetical protein
MLEGYLYLADHGHLLNPGVCYLGLSVIDGHKTWGRVSLPFQPSFMHCHNDSDTVNQGLDPIFQTNGRSSGPTREDILISRDPYLDNATQDESGLPADVRYHCGELRWSKMNVCVCWQAYACLISCSGYVVPMWLYFDSF